MTNVDQTGRDCDRTLIIGIGNEMGGDDAAGLLVVRLLDPSLVSSAVRIVEHTGEAMDLVETWRDVDRVFVVDAVATGAPAGTLSRWEDIAPPEVRTASSHALGLGEAIRLGRALGAIPGSLVIYGIEGTRYGPGDPVSAEVRDASAVAARQLTAEIAALPKTGG